MFIWTVAMALAQAPVEDTSDVDITIVVHGEQAIEDARDEVARAFSDLGWRATERGDSVVFRPPERWIGKATFTPDGRFEFATPVLPVRGGDTSVTGMPGSDGLRGLPQDACGQLGESERVVLRGELSAPEGGTYLGSVSALVSIYRDASADTALWTERQSLALADGRYAATLGTSLDSVPWKDNGYWIGVTVDGERERERVRMGQVAVTEQSVGTDGPCAPAATEFDPYAQQRPAPGLVASVGTHMRPSRERRYAHVRAVLDASSDEVAHYRAVVQETAVRERMAELPQDLDALWTQGTPLYGTSPVGTMTERRTVALELWAGRAANRSGGQICAAIEAWLEGVVVYSDDPITADEYAHYEPLRTDGRTLPRPAVGE